MVLMNITTNINAKHFLGNKFGVGLNREVEICRKL
jgi:hypothetical protein